jgi:hypothetical protein
MQHEIVFVVTIVSTNTFKLNNMMVFNHHGVFTYLDNKYISSFHDVNILCELNLYKNCH